MAWRRPGAKPLSGPMMVSLLTHICVTRPQWVNNSLQIVLYYHSETCFTKCWLLRCKYEYLYIYGINGVWILNLEADVIIFRYNDVTRASRRLTSPQLDCLFNSLFRLVEKGQNRIIGTSWKETTDNNRVTTDKTIKARNGLSIWCMNMSSNGSFFE